MNVSETHVAYNFRVENTGRIFLRIVSNHLPDNTLSHKPVGHNLNTQCLGNLKNHITLYILLCRIDGGVINTMFYV